MLSRHLAIYLPSSDLPALWLTTYYIAKTNERQFMAPQLYAGYTGQTMDRTNYHHATFHQMKLIVSNRLAVSSF
jgi:hypothetical protein